MAYPQKTEGRSAGPSKKPRALTLKPEAFRVAESGVASDLPSLPKPPTLPRTCSRDPIPKTPEERAAAAQKYNMRVEDYEPYPDDGIG